MGDYYRGSPVHQSLQCIADQQLGLGVYTRCGLIQNQYPGIKSQCTSKRQQLFLSDRQSRAPFTNLSCITLRQSLDEFVSMNFTRGKTDAIIGDRVIAQSYVARYVPCIKKNVLQHDAEILSKLLQIQITNINSVNQDLPILN